MKFAFASHPARTLREMVRDRLRDFALRQAAREERRRRRREKRAARSAPRRPALQSADLEQKMMLWFRSVSRVLQALVEMEKRIVKELDDLKAAVARLNTSTTNELKAISAKLTALGDSISPADVESAAKAINAAADALDAETATLTDGAPPAV